MPISIDWKGIGHEANIVACIYHLHPLPDDKILPVLTKTQKTVWRSISKVNVNFGLELDMFQGIETGEEVWDETEKGK
jgi:hypothetical protein